MKRIESPQNTLVKTIRRLAQPGKREDKFLIEGRKLVDAATATVHGRAQIETVVVSSTFSGTVPKGVLAVELPERLFRSVSHLDSPDGILAVAERPSRGELPDRGLLVVCAGIQDPGNLGAIVRVAEAAGVSALVTLPDSADPYGPKAVRGSMGSVLRLPIFELEALEALEGFRLAALVPRDGVDYREADYSRPMAILLGREGAGLDPSLLAHADLALTIPMLGKVESLNVATAAALVLFEAARRGT
jgi:TrmH family RNA methyltransferase